MNLTVVICTHNRAESLNKTLQSVLDAEPPLNLHLKLLVVANACSDQTSNSLKELQSACKDSRRDLSFRWLEEPTPGKSRALNRALRLIDTDAAVFVDDDQRLDNRFFRAIEDGLATYPAINLFCGRLLPDWDGTEPSWVHDKGPYRIFPPPVTMYDIGDAARIAPIPGPMPGGGNLVFRTELLRRLGDFSTDLGPRGHDFRGGEDNEYLGRAFAIGESMQYLPHMVQYHKIDAARFQLRQLMRLSYERTRAGILIREDTQQGVPLYLWRKLLSHTTKALCSINQSRRRFFFVRSAAVLGEVKGFLEKH